MGGGGGVGGLRRRKVTDSRARLTLDKRYLVEHNSTVVLIVRCTPPRDCPFAALALAPQSLRPAALGGGGGGGREGGRAWCVALPCVLLRTDAGPLSGQLIPFRTTRSWGGGGGQRRTPFSGQQQQHSFQDNKMRGDGAQFSGHQ